MANSSKLKGNSSAERRIPMSDLANRHVSVERAITLSKRPGTRWFDNVPGATKEAETSKPIHVAIAK